MAARKRKPVVSSAAIEKVLNTSVGNLEDAKSNCDKAVKSRTAESKKLLNELRRLRKRRLTGMSKKKRAVAADKKESTVASRKNVRTLTSELATTNKTLKVTVAKRSAVLSELSGLKTSLKRLNGYTKGITSTDKAIAKPKRRGRVSKRNIKPDDK